MIEKTLSSSNLAVYSKVDFHNPLYTGLMLGKFELEQYVMG